MIKKGLSNFQFLLQCGLKLFSLKKGLIMKIFQKLILATTMISLPLHCQEACEDYSSCDSSAYYDCGRAAHWSAYVPIAALLVAAIWLGFADNKHTRASCSCSSSSTCCFTHSCPSFSSCYSSCSPCCSNFSCCSSSFGTDSCSIVPTCLDSSRSCCHH